MNILDIIAVKPRLTSRYDNIVYFKNYSIIVEEDEFNTIIKKLHEIHGDKTVFVDYDDFEYILSLDICQLVYSKDKLQCIIVRDSFKKIQLNIMPIPILYGVYKSIDIKHDKFEQILHKLKNTGVDYEYRIN